MSIYSSEPCSSFISAEVTQFKKFFYLIMAQNRIILILAVIFGCATQAATSPSALPVVDLGYAVHQATINKVSPSSRMKDNLGYMLKLQGLGVAILQFQQYQIRHPSSGQPTFHSTNFTNHD